MELQSDTVFCLLMLVAAQSITDLSLDKIMPLCHPNQLLVILLCAYWYTRIWFIVMSQTCYCTLLVLTLARDSTSLMPP